MIKSRILLPLLLLGHFVLLFFTRFTLWPEMVVYPYLLNHGFLLYRDIINPYPPLFLYKLAAFANFFGYRPLPYEVITWLTILLVDVMIFVVSMKITKSQKQALLSTALFAVLSIPFGINGLWFDLVQTPLIITAVYFFARHLEKKRDTIDVAVSSISLAVAFFIKQQALWLILWLLIVLIYKKRGDRKNLTYASLIIITPIVLGMIAEFFFVQSKGIASDFITWTIYLPFFKASQMPGYIFLPTLRQAATLSLLFLFFIPAIFKKDFPQKFFLSVSLVLLLFAYPRFGFFHLIPSLSILAFVFPSAANFKKSKLKLAALSLLIPAFFAFVTLNYLARNWTREVRFFEKDVYTQAQAITEINPSDKPIFLQNVSGQILPLSGMIPTKPWADSFPWYLEIPGVQERVISGIINGKPSIVIYQPYAEGGKYQIASYRPEKLANFIDPNYQSILEINGIWIRASNLK